jgi:glycerophosphoryl diester phosphodiesterase
VLTLQALIDFLLAERERTGRKIGLYPELKQVEYFAARGLDSVQIVLATLAHNGLDGPDTGVWLQSFEAPALMRANLMTDLPLVQLVGGSDPAKRAAQTSPTFLAEVAAYADGIGVPKYGYVIRGEDGLPDDTLGVTPLVDDAHAAGLFVHVYTFRAENEFLPPAFQRAAAPTGNLLGEMLLLLSAGIDGMFTDYPDTGRVACERVR